MDSIEKISRLSLVASDQSYWGGSPSNNGNEPILEGSLLAPYLDSRGPDADLYPNTMPAPFYDPVFTGLSEWTVFDRVDDPTTGFGATVYRRINAANKSDFMVAFQGTRGPNAQDWGGNLGFAVDKWVSAQGGQLLMQVLRVLLIGQDGNAISGDIHFTGQSLGGALAEYAAYDFRRLVNELGQQGLVGNFPDNRIALVTFNGLGGIAGLQKIAAARKEDFDPGLLASATTRHYWIPGDIVHRLGEGTRVLEGQVHLNGKGNAYRLDFFAPTTSELPDTIDGRPRWSNLVDAHRIETGFYSGINRAEPGFLFSENPEDITPLHLTGLASSAIAFGNLYNSYDSAKDGEATARIVATLIYGIAFGDKDEIKVLVEALGESGYRSGFINKRQYEIIQKNLPVILSDFAKSSSGVKLQMRSLILGTLLDSFEQTSTVSQRTVDLVADGSALYNDLNRYPSNPTLDVIRTLTLSYFDKAVGKPEERVRVGYDIARKIIADSISDPALYWEVRQITQQHLDELIPLLFEDNGLKAFLARVSYFAVTSGLDVAVVVGQTTGYIQSLLKDTLKIFDVSALTLSDFATEAISALGETAKGLANAASELASKYANPEISFDEFQSATQQRSTINAFVIGLRSFAETVVAILSGSGEALAEDAARALTEIETIAISAAQTVVILPGRAANPFDDANFDPDDLPIATGGLKEGSVSTFTVYVPYEAGDGGQRVKLKVAGQRLDELSVLLSGEEINLQADGTFTLAIPHGGREASFALQAFADIDADESLTLSAVLVAIVDGEVVETHIEHEEATITLAAVFETPAATLRDIRGDWAPKPYDDGAGVYYKLDDLGNIERLPGVPNTTGFSEPDNKLDGSSGSDHIVTGDYEDAAYGFDGDDSITGSELLPTVISGGVGNDWIEALGYSNHASDFFEFDLLGRTVRLGDDKLYGGAGNDFIYGDAEAAVAALYENGTTATGLPGDWTSGGSGDDAVFGSAGDDVLMGGIGEDRLTGGAGKDVLLGDDHYYLRPEGNFWTVVHPNFGDSTSGYAGFEFGLYPVVNVSTPGSELVFPLTGDPYFTYYKNGGAADILIGGAGDDILIGQSGDDTLYGGEDNDILAGWEGADSLYGGSGDDLMAGDFGRYEQVNQRSIDGFAGDYRLVRAGVLGSTASFGTPVEQVGDDFLDGGAGDDILFGEGGNDVLLGGDGNDTLWGDATYLPDELHGDDLLDGGAGNDLLSGNSGNDKLHGGDGNDNLSGGAGNDILEGGAGDDTLNGGEGNDVLRGGSGVDVLAGNAGSDQLHGGTGDDQLSGGDDDDVLFGDAGADTLDGGTGNDTLYGGSGEDVIDGGEGDDLIDGGAGIDILRGGEGNDTYVVGLGYGRDLIEDAEGENRIRLGSGIVPEDLGAQLDSATLAASLQFSAAGDSVSFDAGQFDVAGIEFSNGTTWGRAEFVGFMPAVVSQGSNIGEVLIGNAKLRNRLDGGGGDDELVGAAYADVLVGGDGDDSLEGNGGADSYVFAPGQEGVDLVSDSGLAALAYLDWYYGARGIGDWAERGEHGGEYRAEGENDGDGEIGTFVEYFDTYEAAYEQFPAATITYVEPLPEIAPVITRNDTQALADLVAAGVLDYDVVEFGAGIALSDLDIRIELDGFAADQYPEQPWSAGGTLSVRWGAAGFDVEVPDVQYGFPGTDIFADGASQGGDPLDGSWRGYRLGEGVEAFQFADGSSYALEEILQRATLVLRYGYEFVRGSGFQDIGREWTRVDFAADIAPGDIFNISAGSDLVFGVVGDSAQGRIAGRYSNPSSVPQMEFHFADGTVWDTDTVTRLGMTQRGGPFADSLVANPFFASALIGLEGGDFLYGGAKNDLLNGGPGHDFLRGQGGDDIYVFGADSEVDVVTELSYEGASGTDTVRFLADVQTTDLSAERNHGTLKLLVNGGSALLWLPEWFTESSGTIELFEFADGTVWDAAAVEALFTPEGATSGDDLLLGFTGDDSLDGLEGDDEIRGFAGNDTLRGGPGDDFLGGGAGDDTYRFGLGDGIDEIWDRSGSNVLQFDEGIEPHAVLVTRDEGYLYLIVGQAGDRVAIQDWFGEELPPIAQVMFANGAIWGPAELESRVTLVPATEYDDILWGTEGADVIAGLAGDDQIYGNDGDDVLDGGDGADYIESGAGHDILRGGAGDDDLEGWPGEGHKLLEGGEGDDYLYYEGRSIAIGGPGDDWIDVYGFNGIVAFNPGDGADTIGVNESFTLSIGGGVDAGDLSLSEDGADIVISVGSLDSVRLTRDEGGGPGSWPAMILQLFGSAHLYYLGGAINEFYNARAADPSLTEFGLGEVLPRYLLLSSETGALGGVIAHQYATRGTIAHVSDALLLPVLQDPQFGPFLQDTAFEGANSAPVLESPLADAEALEDGAFAHTIPADAFADPDAGDALTYTATLEDGSDLPAWLAFDAATRTFSGTPRQADVGATGITITATDGGGLSADDTFALTVANVNDAPTVAYPLADLSFEAGSPLAFALPAATFADEDPGDALALSARLFDGGPLPAWLSFDAAGAAFSGSPAARNMGLWHVQVSAVDSSGEAAAADFGLVIRAIADRTSTGGRNDDVIYGSAGDETLVAKGGSDYLYGDIGDDLLKGGKGNDVLQGGDGADTLGGGKGQNVLDGGAGDDLIFGGKGSSLIAGGTGNDTIRTGSGSDVILFNRGDGMDTVIADRRGDNTLSFGGGIRYSDLSLSRQGKNLIVGAGGDDQIILKNWYGGKHSVLNLQIILDATDEFDAGSSDPLYNKKVQTFDFLGMVSAFDSASAQSPGLTSWAITNALLQFHLSGMDDMALGGDLAYWYGRKNGFSGISLSAAQQVIGAAGFGSDAQSLRPFDGLQEGFAKLA